MFEGCSEINDYITEIFRMGLKESFTQIIDNSEIDGYYLSIPSRDKSKISKLNQWERLFVNIKTKSKRVYGELDTENTFSECLMWAYEEFVDILSGNNENFPIDKDINTLLEERASGIASYVLRCVDLKLKTYISSKRNPNYISHQRGGKREFERIDYYYLDEKRDMSSYDVLEDIVREDSTGEMTELLLEHLKNSDNLTNKQKKYLDAILSGETYVKGSNVYDMDDNVLYNCNQYFFFNRKLAKELQRIIDEDEFIDDSGNRIIFR